MTRTVPPDSAPAPPWAAVRELFERALALDGPGQAALLADPSLDPALVAEVRSLLAHERADDGGGFLAQPATVSGLDDTGIAADRGGQQLGAWRLQHRIGSGGMGEVWLAERADGSYSGRAAVKLLKRGMDSAAVLQRFALERQALARLSHPHIARLLDAGASEDGLPYFVMEYVDGRPIHETALGRPLEERLQLFLQLAGAVAHAHRNLLVHRDLKPGNVLVDREDQVKLLDFGIAKALDPLEAADGHSTVGGVRPYTPHYASPEQVRGEPVSTATDIYSLGVLLYQMLTGARPTGRQATTPMEAARAVLEEEPTRPSRLSGSDSPDPQWLATRRRLQGDLDNILLKALEKSAERRYASVDALAADVGAYLEGRPVSARAASPGYVLGKFVQRNRWAVLAGGAGALGVVTALAATVLQGRVAAALGVAALAAGLAMALVQARRAQLAGQEAARARDEARAQLDRVKRITSDLVFRYGDTVTLMPGGADAQEALLRESIELLEPALQGAPDDLDLLSTMVCALGRLAEIQGNLTIASPRNRTAAERTVARGLALADRAWSQRLGDWRFANWHLRTLIVRAQLLRADGQLQPALDVLAQALERNGAALARQHDVEGRLYLGTGQANVHLTMAQILDHANGASLGRPQEALHAYRLAEAVFRELLDRPQDLQALDRKAAPGDVSTEAYVRHQLGTILGGRALIHLRQEDLQAMRVEAETALRIRELNVAGEPLNVAWRDGLMTEAHTLALAQVRLGEMPAALQAAQLAWDTAQALARDQGSASKWAAPKVRAMLAATLGRALLGNGRAGDALPLLEEGSAYWRSQGDQPDARRRAAWFEVRRAEALQALRRSDEARGLVWSAVQALRPLCTSGPVVREAQLTSAEAHALLALLQPAEAATHRQAAVQALLTAQDCQPPGRLGADHQRLLAALQSSPG